MNIGTPVVVDEAQHVRIIKSHDREQQSNENSEIT